MNGADGSKSWQDKREVKTRDSIEFLKKELAREGLTEVTNGLR